MMFSSGPLEAVSRGKSPMQGDSGLPGLGESLIIKFLSVSSNPEAILSVTDAEMKRKSLNSVLKKRNVTFLFNFKLLCRTVRRFVREQKYLNNS